MLEFVILAAVGYGGYTGAPAWIAPLGAAAITVGGWWRKVALLRQDPPVPFSTKMTTYLVVSIGINLSFAFASLLVGRYLQWALG